MKNQEKEIENLNMNRKKNIKKIKKVKIRKRAKKEKEQEKVVIRKSVGQNTLKTND